jgi:outer membrane protein TolC
MIRTITAVAAASLTLLVGCATSPKRADAAANEHPAAPISEIPPLHAQLPALAPDASPDLYVRYALSNHPAVAAAWHDWRAAEAAIMPARSLPDPQLTFQADIASTLMSLMPGVMFDLMTPGKRAAMGHEAQAGATVARRQYEGALVRVAAEARKALLELSYLDEAIRLRDSSVASAEQTAALAASEYAAGRGMGASLDLQLKSADEATRLRSESAGLGERRIAARARLKSALGLLPTDPDPQWPRHQLAVTPLPPADELWRRVQTANPDLATMRAMVEMAVAGVDVAQRRGTPDFTVGLMTDVKQAPWMWRPTATMTLPIWRGKIRETIAAAQARHEAASARVDAEQLTMAAELAQMLAMVREADRMIGYIDSAALPSLERTRATATSGYRTGASGATMIAAAGGMELAMRAERLAALRERELAVVDLLAITSEVAPASP